MSADREAAIRAWKRDPENAALLMVEEVREALAELAAARERLAETTKARDAAIRMFQAEQRELAAARKDLAEEMKAHGETEREKAKLREALRRMVSSFDRLLTISESHGILSRESATSFAATSAHGHNVLLMVRARRDRRTC